MGYYAKLNTNNIVEQVIIASPEVIETYDGAWVETFIDDPAKQYAGIGMGWTGAEFAFKPFHKSEWTGSEWITPFEMGIVGNASPIITADGINYVKVYIIGNANEEQSISINGEPLSVVTDEKGYGEFELASDTAGLITIAWSTFALEVAAI